MSVQQIEELELQVLKNCGTAKCFPIVQCCIRRCAGLQAETVRQELAQLHQRARRSGIEEAELQSLQASSDEMQVQRY